MKVNFQPNKNISFGNDIFKIVNVDNIPCAYCRREMISSRTLNKLFSPHDDPNVRYIDLACENRDYLRPFQRKVLNFLSLSEYTNGFEDDEKFIQGLCFDAKREVWTDIRERFIDIFNVIKNSGDRRLIEFMDKEGLKCYHAMKRKASYANFMDFVRGNCFLGIKPEQKQGVEGLINEIVSEIENLSEHTIASYISKKADKRPVEMFYKDLFEKSTSSIEHIKPRSKKGEDKLSNYLAVCRECNSKRDNTSFFEFLKRNPEISGNIEAQLKLLKKMVPKLISTRKLSKDYSDYPQRAAKTIKTESHYTLDISI